MAPLAPFFAEYAYQRLRPLHPDFKNESVAVDAPGKLLLVHPFNFHINDPKYIYQAQLSYV